MNHATRVTLEGQRDRIQGSVVWDRDNVERLQRQLLGYLKAQLEDEIALAELEASLEEDA